MKIFKIEKFLKDSLRRNNTWEEIKQNLSWAEICHNKESINNYILNFRVYDDWCEEIKE